MDFFEALGFKHYQGSQFQDDTELRKNYIDRIYDTYIDEEELQACDQAICDVANSLEPKAYTSREFITELGKFLKKNAKKIYSIDVGTNQLHEKLKKEKKIISIENFNAKYLDNSIIHEKINLVVCDVSFISLTKVIEPSLKLLSSKAEIISLIKPQFETNKINLKKGIVKDPLIHEQVCNYISNWFKKTIKAEVVGLVESPITGPKGNKEFLIYSILKKS